MKTRRRKVRWGRIFLLLFILAAFAVSFAGAVVYAYNTFFHHPAQPVASVADAPKDTLNNRINILLMGVDDGDADNHSTEVRRTDTMILLSINPSDSSIKLLSIPRDTRVTIPGRSGYDKINHAYAYGGHQLAVRTVENFLGISINSYVVIDWKAFIKVIDILGGVDLYVEQNMHYTDPYANLNIDIKKGFQHLDGEKAGEYVRFRTDELGDIGRVQRQQRFLRALSDQILQPSTIIKLPSLISTLNEYVSTDMNFKTMLTAANSLKFFKSGNIETEMLPGNFATIQGISYWVPDREQTNQMVYRMFIEEKQVGKAISNNRIN